MKKGRLPEPDERETPPELFASLHARFNFTLDAAAAHDNAKLPIYNTKEGGFSTERDPTTPVVCKTHAWMDHRVFCNPPYSDIGAWVAQAWTSEAEMVYMLVPNWTDRAWWLDLVEPYRDGRAIEQGFHLSTEFMKRQRFLYKGLPIKDVHGRIGSPEFGLVGLIWTRKGESNDNDV